MPFHGSNQIGKNLSFENADIVESELRRVTTQPVQSQTTGKTSGTVHGLGIITTDMNIKKGI